MYETLSVSLCAPSFSFLLYENVISTYGQEGFLLGEIVEKQKKTITDNDQRQVHISRTIKINSSVPCPQLCHFYDSIGRLDVERIKEFLGDLAPKVVAWYKYKPIASSPKFTFREILLHKQLADFFQVCPDYFTCCLLLTESAESEVMYSWTQNFVRLKNTMLEYVPLHIINLSDPKDVYKSPQPVSETFSNILRDLKVNYAKTQGLTVVRQIQSALEKHTKQTAVDLVEVEQRLAQLEKDVLKTKEVMRHRKINDVTTREIENNKTNNEGGGDNRDDEILNDSTLTPKTQRGRGRKRVNQSPKSGTLITPQQQRTPKK